MNQPTYASGLLFTKAHKAVRDSVVKILEQHALTPSYWALIGAVVAAPDGIRLTNVASQMGVKAPLITLLANDLMEQGLINRVPHHTDGRAKLLVTTPKGRKLATIVEGRLALEIARLMHGLSETDVAGFTRSLQVILENSAK